MHRHATLAAAPLTSHMVTPPHPPAPHPITVTPLTSRLGFSRHPDTVQAAVAFMSMRRSAHQDVKPLAKPPCVGERDAL